MPLSIRIISSPDGESISEWNKAFPEEGGSIGRAFGAIMQLSDANREVSGSHAIIKKTPRGYQVMDNSTNGLFINGADNPLGNGNQTTLSDGDVLDIGRYRLLVSCFIPELAQAQEFANLPNTNDVFSDDPFSDNDNDVPFSPSPVKVEPSFDFTSKRQDVVDDDPFEMEEIKSNHQHKELNLSFAALDDDPLGELDFKSNIPIKQTAIEPQSREQHSSEEFALQLFRQQEERMQQQMDKALEMALNRLLSDISPHAMESMFNDLSAPSFWGGKPKYWDMYKRYFSRQVENKDWQIKFHAYFHDAIRVQRNLDGENQ